MGADEELARLRADLADGQASDGVHTHAELYEARMLYNAHAARMWCASGIPVVKSWRHHDGEPCFDGDFFIVVASLPVGQVSNHYRRADWDLFAVPEVPLAPVHDGHTSEVATGRLRRALVEVEVKVPRATPENPRQGSHWSLEEDVDLIEEVKEGMTSVEIAERHRRTTAAINSRLRRGLPEEVREGTSREGVLVALHELWESDPDFDWIAELRRNRAASRARRAKRAQEPREGAESDLRKTDQ